MLPCGHMMPDEHAAGGVEEALAPLWRALADPTRRAILDLLRQRPRTTGELAEAFPSSRYAVMKHLTVLVDAGLVVSRRRGRERWNHLNAVPLQQLYERWVRPYEAHWASRLAGLKEHVELERGEPSMTQTASGVVPCVVAQVELEIPIKASPERVWTALVDETGRWWRKDFYTVAQPATFVMEPRAGGRVFERSETGAEVLWYTTVTVDPGRSLDLVGHITVAHGGPTTTMVRLVVDGTGDSTVVRLSDSLMGRISDEFATATHDGWWKLFGEGLKPYVEGK